MSARTASPEVVAEQVVEISRRLRACAGGIELVDLDDEGVAHLRFTGMCTGCPTRPMTSAWSVKPDLLALEGVNGVEIQGTRISAEAEERMMRYFEPYMPKACPSGTPSQPKAA